MESERLKLSRIFSWVRKIKSNQSEFVPGRALLKDQFSCCIQWSYTVTQSQLPANTKHDKTPNADEFGPKWSTAVAAEQKIRDTASVRDIWFTSSNGGRTIWKSQGYVQFDELCLGLESIHCNITCL